VIASIQVYLKKQNGCFGTITDVAGATESLLKPLQETIRLLNGQLTSAPLDIQLRPTDEGYRAVIHTVARPDVFVVTQRNIILKGKYEGQGGAREFVGRPIRREDLRPGGFFRVVDNLVQSVAPTLYASGHGCCCKRNSEDNCSNVEPSCTGCGACDEPLYCCVQGFEDCEACCAADQSDCFCVWANPFCDGGGGGCPI
jgi:hypothetical protein